MRKAVWACLPFAAAVFAHRYLIPTSIVPWAAVCCAVIAAAGFLEGTILSYGWITVLSSLLGLPLFADWKELWEIGGMTVFFGILAGIVPAWRAANATVAECLEA